MDKTRTLGIIGGVGPMATVYFMEMLIDMTDAARDQDHINMIVYNHSTIPDRTDYILDKSKKDPLPDMIHDAKMLQSAGADLVVVPCNTAQYFLEGIKASIKIPMLNIVDETVAYAKRAVPGLKRLGILATNGTVKSGVYDKACKEHLIECVVPNEAAQQIVMKIIYEQVKAGKMADISAVMSVIESMKSAGCQAVVLGCTELSLVKKSFSITRPDVIDSLEVLAKRTILACGKKLKARYADTDAFPSLPVAKALL